MPTHAEILDPRSIITPDAFEVSEALLGMPLARPGRRLVAILVDLAVIGVITLLTQSFALILGVVAGVFFVRMSFKRTEVPGSAFGRAMRLSLGCLGLFIALVTAVVWVAVSAGPRLADLERLPGVTVNAPESPGGSVEAGLGDLAGFLGGGVGLVRAETAAEARDAMEVLVRRGRNVGSTDAEIEDVVLELVPEEAAWSDDAEILLAEAMERVGSPSSAGAAAPAPTPGGEESLARTLEEYAVLVQARDEGLDETGEARRVELRALLVQELAADTLAALENEIEQLGSIAETRQETIRGLRRELEAAEEGGGIFAWLRGLVDELGFGFGWASLYMTVVLSWWKGQTVGKKLMGIRVVRLDGEPINWWTAFERAGGYAAGFATGLLGFAQVWWDANRQAIHDRIVGTVVVVDGAEPVRDWEKAL